MSDLTLIAIDDYQVYLGTVQRDKPPAESIVGTHSRITSYHPWSNAWNARFASAEGLAWLEQRKIRYHRYERQ